MEYNSYKIITKRKQVKTLINHCKKTGYASVDFETNGESFGSSTSYPTILGVSFQPGFGYIIPLGHFDSPFLKNDEWIEILKEFGREVIENTDIIKIAQNLKFEYCWFKKYGITMRGRLFDTLLAKYLLDEERPNDLKSLTQRYLPLFGGYEDYEGSKLPWDKKPLEGLSKYCALDTDMAFRLMIFFEDKLLEHGFYNLFRNMMMMASRVLGDSEFHGMNIDVTYLDMLVETKAKELEELEKKLYEHKVVIKYNEKRRKANIKNLINEVKEEISDIRREIDEFDGLPNSKEGIRFRASKERLIKAREEKITRYLSGDFRTKNELKVIEDVNFNSPNQLIELLFTSRYGFKFDIVKFTVNKDTKQETDRPSTDEEVLTELSMLDKTGFIVNLLELRGLNKLYGTYIKGMREKVTDDERVHGTFLLHGTVTGRLSSKEPNLQNIPRDTTAKDIKRMFIPPKGYVIMQVDYSQAELRVLASVANETSMLEWFRTGKDIHLASACKKFKVDYDDVKAILDDENHPEHKLWKTRRKQAKTINFGIVYGQGPKLLAVSLSDPKNGLIVTKEEAMQFLKDFARDFPNINKFIKKQHKLVHRNEFVVNLFGRKRRLPNITSDENWMVAEAERASVNAPIQGAASDFTLFSSILIRNEILKGKLPRDMIQAATVHDSLIYYIKPKDIHKAVPIIDAICKNPSTKAYFGFEITNVSMQVDFEVGSHWGNLKNYKEDFDYHEILGIYD